MKRKYLKRRFRRRYQRYVPPRILVESNEEIETQTNLMGDPMMVINEEPENQTDETEDPMYIMGEIARDIKVPEKAVLSSLPASQKWPGQYGFSITFQPQEQNVKSSNWTYSHIKDKVYIIKGDRLPVHFSTNCLLMGDVIIRATAHFTLPQHSVDLVHRCVNHSMGEIENGIPEAEHLIRCESKSARYYEHPVTQRHSVLVPFVNPAVGEKYFTVIYSFACYGSCPGGPNRRPLMLIFTLEQDGNLIGRQRVDLKICACPARDKATEERQYLEKEAHNRQMVKQDLEQEKNPLDHSYNANLNDPQINLTPKSQSQNKRKLALYIKDVGCYRFLLVMERLWQTHERLRRARLNVKRLQKKDSSKQ